MLRTAGGVILGYAAMATFVFGTFTALYLAMGAEGAFRPGTYDVSTAWIVGSLLLSAVAAVLGGWVCATIGRSSRAVGILAILVLLLGVVSALMEAQMRARTVAEPRLGDVPNLEAMTRAVQPEWISWLLPVIGAAGVRYGGRRAGASAALQEARS
jgi:hypothetical protein